ncbi:MAG: hypothetical protein ACK4NV_14180 [Pannonibacter sp.]|jgi:hypothetical protein
MTSLQAYGRPRAKGRPFAFRRQGQGVLPERCCDGGEASGALAEGAAVAEANVLLQID